MVDDSMLNSRLFPHPGSRSVADGSTTRTAEQARPQDSIGHRRPPKGLPNQHISCHPETSWERDAPRSRWRGLGERRAKGSGLALGMVALDFLPYRTGDLPNMTKGPDC